LIEENYGMWSPDVASNMNFPAHLAVVGFLAACGGTFVAPAAILILWFARKPKLARLVAMVAGTAAVIYLALLLGFSASSRSNTMALGQEKYFCEIDCHLAYSVVDVKRQPNTSSTDLFVTLRTRFDETTTSANRPKDAPLTPPRREVRLVDGEGRMYSPISSAGSALMTPLKPAESYTTQLVFQVPRDAGGLRLLIRAVPAWPDHVVIGDENSWGHRKTYLAL
jgi:hypothetical protein